RYFADYTCQLSREEPTGYPEVDQETAHIDQRGDECSGGRGGVEAQSAQYERQHRPDEGGAPDDAEQGSSEGNGEEDGIRVVGLADQACDPHAADAEHGEEQAEDEPDAELAAHDAPPIAQSDLADGHGADDQCGRLGAGVAAAGDPERHEDGESLDGRDEVLEPADGGSGQHAAEEEDDEPGCALADEIEETDAEVGLVECLEAAVLVDVLGGFFLDDVDDVVDGDDTL